MLPGIFSPAICFSFNLFMFFIGFPGLTTPLWLNFDSSNRISSTILCQARRRSESTILMFIISIAGINSNKSLSFERKILVHYALPGERLRHLASFWCSKGLNGKYYAAYKYTHKTSYLKIEINVTQLVLLKIPTH